MVFTRLNIAPEHVPLLSTTKPAQSSCICCKHPEFSASQELTVDDTRRIGIHMPWGECQTPRDDQACCILGTIFWAKILEVSPEAGIIGVPDAR